MDTHNPTSPFLPTTFTIFGITGDLSKRKLLPAIYHLYEHQLLPEHIEFIGVALQELSEEDFRAMIVSSVQDGVRGAVPKDKLEEFTTLFRYVNGDLKGDKLYNTLQRELTESDANCETPHQSVFYLAVAPQLFIPIIQQLDKTKLTGPCPRFGIKAKIVIEKPFGQDVQSAQDLNELVMQYADEEQIYRMDHYLGKETVQNMLLFRFTNPVINDSWNPDAIERIEISATEDIGVEHRTAYYDGTGALRDMVQSHCLTLLALALMDEPISLRSGDIHARKEEILQTLSVSTGDGVVQAVRAQYDGYKTINSVAPNSSTETFARVRLQSSHPRWKNVPLVITTGKRLKQKETTIRIFFTPCKSNICKTQGIHTEPNVLDIHIQPREGISLRLYAKQPGFSIQTQEIDMSFDYERAFTGEQPSPYERLIHDVIIGDQSLFPSTAEVIQQWNIVQPVLDAWADNLTPLLTYSPDSDGPEEPVLS